MSLKIYKLKDVDFSRIVYSKPILSKNKTSIYTSYDDVDVGKIPLIFQVPSLYCPENIIPIRSEHITHELLVPLIGINQKVTDDTIKFFKEFDNKIIKDTKKYKKKWNITGTKLQYKVIIKLVESDDYIFKNGVIKIKFIKTKSFKTDIYVKKNKTSGEYSNNNKYKLVNDKQKYKDIFNGNCYVKILMECVSIWYKDNTFGVYLKPHQVRVDYKHPPTIVLSTYSFIDDSYDYQSSENNVKTSESIKNILLNKEKTNQEKTNTMYYLTK